MKLKTLAAASFSVFFLSVGVAKADDFIALCTKSDQSAGVDTEELERVCSCASSKITKSSERALAMEAMKAIVTAITSDRPDDMAAISRKYGQGIEIMLNAEAVCM